MIKRIGKYELLEFLGGGMSHVYRARDTVIDRVVAVKVLTGAADEAARKRFLHEARLAGSLNHPNIVRIYDFGEDDGQPYLVMEYLQGETLGDALRAGRAGDLDARVRIAAQIAEALRYVHSRELIHRDIKPENIYLNTDGRVLLLDFGIAKSESVSLTRAGHTMGTPHYMAPEQLMGKPITRQADIYSFGILLYQLVAGKRPFEAETIEQTFWQMLNQPLPVDPLNTAGVPQGLIDLIVRCTAKDAAGRPVGFGEVLDALRDPVPSSAPPPPPVTAAAERVSPSRLWLIAAVILPALLLALVIFLPRMRVLSGGGVPGESGNGAAVVLTLLAIAAALLLVRRRNENTPLPVESQEPLKALAASASASTQAFRVESHDSPAPAPAPPDGQFTSKAIVGESIASIGDITGAATGLFRLEQPATAAPQLPDASLAIIRSNYSAALVIRATIRHTPFRIGRTDADLDLTFDPAVSIAHAEIDFHDGGFTIRDLGSSNGTFVDGRRLAPREAVPLLFGSTLLLGSNTQIAFVSADMEEMPDLTGHTVAGRFRLKQKLHGSAKSAVYAADDTNLAQPAAVKILSPRLVSHPGYRQQFDREAKMASRLRHANICRVVAFGETDLPGATARTLYVAFEYLDGGSLSSRLARGESFDAATVAVWLESLGAAVDHMHTKDVVHGGIKPSVIVFDGGGNPYLTDFAIASTRGDSEHRVVIGAPAFLAPEQWEGATPVPSSDQYSLAVVAYLLLTGSQPFEGQENPEVRSRNLSRGAAPAHELAARNGRPAVPPRLSQVLAKAMAAEPANRHANAAEFAAAFRSSLKEVPARPFVFLSYQRATSAPWAQLFKNELERQFGYDVFLDVGQRDTAGRFPRKIEQAISRCHVFVCILGAATLDSEWVLREIELASTGKKPMVPVFQESFEHPRDTTTLAAAVQDLLSFDGVKLLDRQNIYVDATIRSLAESIRQSIPD